VLAAVRINAWGGGGSKRRDEQRTPFFGGTATMRELDIEAWMRETAVR